jgi:hypothetical protein
LGFRACPPFFYFEPALRCGIIEAKGTPILAFPISGGGPSIFAWKIENLLTSVLKKNAA